jgi:hypothetical protein
VKALRRLHRYDRHLQARLRRLENRAGERQKSDKTKPIL